MTAADFQEAASRLTKRLAEAKFAVDSAWARQGRLTEEMLAKLSRIDAALASMARTVDAWTNDDRLRALTGRQTAKSRAHAVLDGLKGQGLIEGTTYDRAVTLVDVLFTPNTVYASISSDDGGVTFYWRAGDMSIEIDIHPAEGFWWRVRNVAAENYSGHGAAIHQYDQLKHSLKMFSKEVDRANPHWRQQII
ncbi:hypothetical protein [Mycobacterium sp. E2699]|uniref:hypothetical protein n=1 Tax=Mycobacterium sp. E2699 TaxID=1834137 RepID=UPI0012E9A372|nr:hypothetical protein [Mycobacterium sp. E2699]